MDTAMAITEIIKSRYSCRSYNGTPVGQTAIDKLSVFLEKNTMGPFATKTRFTIFAAREQDNDALKGLGTYGFIRGASAFIVGAVKGSEYDLEDYGYLMEKNILYATDLGLGTCWLGGSFKKSVFSEKIKTEAGEYVPAVAASGNRASRRRLFDAALRLSAGSSKRKPFHELFRHNNFATPLLKERAAIFATPLEMLRLSPSASNKQPWRIVWEEGENRFHFYRQRTKNYYERNKNLFGLADMQRIDMGIAMCHFELASDEQNIFGEWEVKNPGLDDLPGAADYLVSRKIV